MSILAVLAAQTVYAGAAATCASGIEIPRSKGEKSMLKLMVKAMLASLTALILSAPVKAQSFDYLLLAASWQPGFCVSHKTKPECVSLKGTYGASNLALHGLWPNAYDGNHPFYCNVPQKDITLDMASNWCAMDPYGVSSTTKSTLTTYMPGIASCLDEHEWFKHGSCDGQTPDAYWGSAINVMSQFGHTSFNTFLKNNAGKYVTTAQMLTAFEGTFGTGTRAAASLNCTKTGTISYFTEIWVALNKNALAQFPSKNALVLDGPVSNTCPSTKIFIALP
jgi:ribonuclease T2